MLLLTAVYILLKLPILNSFSQNNQPHLLQINNIIQTNQLANHTIKQNLMSITTIANLTYHIKNDTTEVNLSSTLPTKLYRIQSLLNLSNNNIAKIQNISHLRKLKTLNLEFNQIKVVQNLQKLVSLQHLLLGYNAITTITSNIVQNTMLKVIDLSYNILQSIDSIQPLFRLDIQSLCLQGNSVISRINYTNFMKTLIPSLILLDNKDINLPVESPFYSELNADEEVLVLRDTLNKLLEERNYLAEELQNLTSVTSPTKINLKDYLKYQSLKEGQSLMNCAEDHSVERKICQQLNGSESQVRISTFSPIKHIEPKPSSYKNNQKSINSKSFKLVSKKSRQQESVNIKQKKQQQFSSGIVKQRQRMLQILQYWKSKLSQKLVVKKNEVEGLHEYYAQRLEVKRQERKSAEKRYQQEDQDDAEDDKDNCNIINDKEDEFANTNKYLSKKENKNFIKEDKCKDILNKIKSQQGQSLQIDQQIRSLQSLITDISSLPIKQQLYKTILMRVLFGDRDRQTSKRRRVNYRQLKRYLLSDYGLLNVVNDLGRVICGEEGVELSIEKIRGLKESTEGRSLMEMVSKYKEQLQEMRRQKRQFERQKQAYMEKLEQETNQLCERWTQFNQTKTSYELQKGSQLRYQTKLMQQKQIQLHHKLQQLSRVHTGKLKSIQQHKQQLQNEIGVLEQKISQLETQRQRSQMELHQIQNHISTAASTKEELLKLDTQLAHLKKLIFTQKNQIHQKNLNLKHLSLEEDIASERLAFLEKKCAQKMQQLNQIEQQQRNLSQKLILIKQQQKQKNLSLSALNTKLAQLHQQQSSILKQIQRHRQNLTLFEQKLANLAQLQTHRKKSLQQLQLQNAEFKAVSVQLSEKNFQLQQIMIKKQETIHAYLTKINQHKMQLQTYTDLNKNMQSLIQRQAELKRNILQLEIHNGNLLDLKNQLVKDNKNHQLPLFNLKPHWASSNIY